VYAEALSANAPLLADVRARFAAGLVTWAECGGLLWLSRSLNGHELCGVVNAAARMTESLTLGYRTARVLADNPVTSVGDIVRGHEFHYSALEPEGRGLELSGRSGARVEGHTLDGRLLATYLHLHMGANPAPAEQFVAAADRAAARRDRRPGGPSEAVEVHQ
jgi:cobyrinic acid a,c-diamide synthase